MVHQCAACKCELEAQDSNNEDQTSSTILPNGWFTRCIGETDYILCDVCGAQIHFRGGISPYLTDCLELADDARCDMTAEASVVARERRQNRKGG